MVYIFDKMFYESTVHLQLAKSIIETILICSDSIVKIKLLILCTMLEDAGERHIVKVASRVYWGSTKHLIYLQQTRDTKRKTRTSVCCNSVL